MIDRKLRDLWRAVDRYGDHRGICNADNCRRGYVDL